MDGGCWRVWAVMALDVRIISAVLNVQRFFFVSLQFEYKGLISYNNNMQISGGGPARPKIFV